MGVSKMLRVFRSLELQDRSAAAYAVLPHNEVV